MIFFFEEQTILVKIYIPYGHKKYQMAMTDVYQRFGFQEKHWPQ
jgi:hypothetical protein